MLRQEKAALCVGLSEMQAYVRIETGEEEALIAGLLRVATEQCELFIGQVLMARSFEQDLEGASVPVQLSIRPVRAVSSVIEAKTGIAVPDGAIDVAIDIDGIARLSGLPRGQQVRVSGTAGMGTDCNDIPESLRQGILRLAAHLFANRDSAAGDLPKAVSALWRPFRSIGLFR